ncbi:uncharacterized protein LTHEOB_3242 [Lasiodiplodia theobromae]|uniref:uncharacterized protein n=1 Tax=Lasiodiplodia theobromae TaxID=45133 RepID=UPI0015C30D0D|nr:uncharacterized protein LTHEOB_3242 [Lasiodiplodia theobromae]KAF4534434.1 hypothetical protein LTHEOB_3242 [Lasiodiplodia theobromae]
MSDAWFQTKLTTAAAAAEDDNAVSALRIYTPPLQRLFTGTASAATTADTLIASNLDDRAELLWHLIYAAAAELPEHHAALVNLLLALQSRNQQTQPSPAPALASWLTLFGPTWRARLDALRAAREDGFDRAARFDADGKKLPREGDMYVNFHAFSARLLGAGFAPDARGMLRDAAWKALAGVLEREVEGYDGGIVREGRFEIEKLVLFWLDVWAGVQWVVFAGEEVRGGEGQKGQQEGESGGLLEVNGLWKGAEGFSEERWGFWRERLRGFLEVRGAVPEPVRGVVEEAVRCME